jgi:tripartite-type tricarboxylate transporter receptor subunit TctC
MRAGAVHGATLAIALAAIGATGAAAQDDFKAWDISLYVRSGAGGAYDTYVRLVARHFVEKAAQASRGR